jgi:hypothetical protein
VSSGGLHRGEAEQVTYGFQVSDTFTGCVPGLRAQQTSLFEDEARPDEDPTDECQNYANDLYRISKRRAARCEEEW